MKAYCDAFSYHHAPSPAMEVYHGFNPGGTNSTLPHLPILNHRCLCLSLCCKCGEIALRRVYELRLCAVLFRTTTADIL